MNNTAFPKQSDLIIQFAHPAYQLTERFALRDFPASTGMRYFQTYNPQETLARIGEAHVLVVSGLWHDQLLNQADKLQFIQSIGAGYDQFPQDQLRERGIRLANASGVNKNAVSEHAMALILALARHIHTGRDNQHKQHWRGMISDIDRREDELGGKTLLIAGLGAIGSRLAKLAKAFDMQVIATKQNPGKHDSSADEVHPATDLMDLLPRADFVALTCPLTPATENLIDSAAFASMKPSAYLINIARGRCVDEPALLNAVQKQVISGAAIDHFWDEPLPADSPFWALENVLITPHTGGETRRYEDNLIDILLDNLERLAAEKSATLYNQII